MNDEDKLKDIIAKGKDADKWLNHPQFRHVITLRKAQLITAFEKTKFKDSEEREEIWRKVQALNSVVNEFERIIRDAKQAEMTLLQKVKSKFRAVS